ncbi:MAG: SpoIIE family protein phosphatase [Planctomycetes bacterium]|nr:SpoIIE family protein phosphatase [Planctomycetota bacterium]
MAKDLGSARLLVVEDEELTREALRERLAMAGHTVAAAASGPAAMEHIHNDAFDAVLLDVGLPGLSGFAVLEQIRAKYEPSRLPVLMMTGLSGRDDVVRGLNLGASDYIAKPFDFPVILARIETQLALKRAHDERARLQLALSARAEELEAANRALAEANRRMKSDLRWAARLQRSMLPAAAPPVPGVEFTWAYRPCDELGGDLLNVFAIDEDHVGIYMIDVSGHGMKAALLSVQVSRVLALVPDQPCLVRRRQGGVGPFEPTPPAEVALELNRRFQLDETFDLYFTLFYGVLDTRTLELRYLSAGHPGPIHVDAAGGLSDLSRPVFAIGWVEAPEYAEQRLRLAAGDRLYLYSDGVSDARNAGREIYGAARVAEALLAARSVAIDESVGALLRSADGWRGAPADDDVTALALEVRPVPAGVLKSGVADETALAAPNAAERHLRPAYHTAR